MAGRNIRLPSGIIFSTMNLFNWDNNFADSGNSIPAVNIKEKPDSFLVEMAAPGMEQKRF